MRLALAFLAFALAACGSIGNPAGPDGDSPPPGNPPDPAPPGPLPSLGGCQIFPADNAWNRDVTADPVHPGSAALLAEMAPDNSIHLDLGTTEEYYGIPYTIVPADQPLVPITFGTGGYDYSEESDPGPMPIPLDAHIEGGSTDDPDPPFGDRHVLVLRQGDCRLFELFNTVRTESGFQVSSSATWDLTTNDTRPAGWTSADAAGLPILPGLLKYEEVAEDRLHHALRFTVPRVRRAYTAPASHCGQDDNAALPPYGTRVRLRQNFPLDDYSGDALVILTAMKRYGLILADQGSAWYVTGTANPAWEDALDQLRDMRVRGSDFEVLASGPVTVC
ncbi:MAG TPA: hypothetical protein VFR72_00055 [Gemmatimonadales bacterium]|nr:hypothetical protein [Gemmatimonadales bacterium]